MILGDSIVPNTVIEIVIGSENVTMLGLTADFGPCPGTIDNSFTRPVELVSYKHQGKERACCLVFDTELWEIGKSALWHYSLQLILQMVQMNLWRAKSFRISTDRLHSR